MKLKTSVFILKLLISLDAGVLHCMVGQSLPCFISKDNQTLLDTCIHASAICDGTAQCLDGRDEHNCRKLRHVLVNCKTVRGM